MTKYVSIVLAASAVTIIGIVASLPLVVTAGTLVACGTLLFAILSYIGAAH